MVARLAAPGKPLKLHKSKMADADTHKMTTFELIIIVVIITWTGEETPQKMSLISQLSGSLIRSNGLNSCKI